jgi:hypothetical protein
MTKSERKNRNTRASIPRRDKALADVRRKIQVGLEQLNRGEGIPGEKVFKELRRKSRLLRLRRSKWK